MGAVQTLLGDALTGSTLGQICYAVLAFLILVAFLWAGARVLLWGKLTWRQLLPAAVLTAIGAFDRRGLHHLVVADRYRGRRDRAIVGSWYVARDFSFPRWLHCRFSRHAHTCPDHLPNAVETPIEWLSRHK